MTPGGQLTTLYSFCSKPNCTDGALADDLVQTTDGQIFGTTQKGGDLTCSPPYGCGTIFRLGSLGTIKTLYTAEYGEGIYPFSLLQANDGLLYGAMGGQGPKGWGTLFQLSEQEGLTTLYGFGNPYGPSTLMQDTSGTFYGTTDSTVFSFDTGLGPFIKFVIPAGKVGATGGILGQGFTGTTSVMLNGVPANFTVMSDTFLTATVPAGATSGYVTVTTPSGVLKSNVAFRVIR